MSSALSVGFRLSLFCLIVCLRYLAFACCFSIGPCVACVLPRLPGGMACVLLLQLCGISVLIVVYHVLALDVRCRSYRSFMLPTLGGLKANSV